MQYDCYIRFSSLRRMVIASKMHNAPTFLIEYLEALRIMRNPLSEEALSVSDSAFKDAVANKLKDSLEDSIARIMHAYTYSHRFGSDEDDVSLMRDVFYRFDRALGSSIQRNEVNSI